MNPVRSSAWYPAPSSVSPRARGWLQNRGSLTQLIQQRCCSNFRVKQMFQSLDKACGDELAVMNLRRNELALVREVYLYCGNTPVVFAHSVVARKDLRGAWRGLSGLGNRSLGTVLFTNPVIRRTPLRFKKLNPAHPLFHRACQKFEGKTERPVGAPFAVQLARAIHTRDGSISSFHSGAGIVTLTQRLGHYEKLMRLDKPIGILLLLWPTLWGLWLAADGVPSMMVLAIFVMGTVLMRSAGCVVNDYADRNFDAHVERTKNRPLATRQVSTKEALLLAAGLSLCAFLLILPLNRLTH